MPRKDKQKRLTMPLDIWQSAKFDDFERCDFGFFISNDSRIIITNVENGRNENFEFLGKCGFDCKHRCFIPENVDAYLGEGDIYYFTTHTFNYGVYIYKIDREITRKRQELQLQALLAIL